MIRPINAAKEAGPELSFPKALLFSAGYFALLLPALSFALNRYVDMADPPVLDPNVNHSFWLSGAGEWVWFGAAFILPGLGLVAFIYMLKWARKVFAKR